MTSILDNFSSVQADRRRVVANICIVTVLGTLGFRRISGIYIVYALHHCYCRVTFQCQFVESSAS